MIPHKANEKNKPAFFARTLYKARSRIEQGFGRLKRFKRVALRCEKTARKFPIYRQFRCRALLDQIRPHGLAVSLARNISLDATWLNFFGVPEYLLF